MSVCTYYVSEHKFTRPCLSSGYLYVDSGLMYCSQITTVWSFYGSKMILDRPKSPKWPSELQFCERYSCSWQKKWLETVVKQTFRPVANFGHQALGLIDLPKSGWRGSLPSPGPPTVLLKWGDLHASGPQNLLELKPEKAAAFALYYVLNPTTRTVKGVRMSIVNFLQWEGIRMGSAQIKL